MAYNYDKKTCPILKLCRKKALFKAEAIFSSLFYASMLFICVVGFIVELREKLLELDEESDEYQEVLREINELNKQK